MYFMSFSIGFSWDRHGIRPGFGNGQGRRVGITPSRSSFCYCSGVQSPKSLGKHGLFLVFLFSNCFFQMDFLLFHIALGKFRCCHNYD